MCVGRIISENQLVSNGSVKTVEQNVQVDNKRLMRRLSRKLSRISAEPVEYKDDSLAVMTQQTQMLIKYAQQSYKKFQKSYFYKILFYTTQPAHVITALSVLCIAYMMLPSKSKSPISPIWTLVYLGCFSAHFGAQIWMTFVSGLALYFNLSRHTFGNVQRVLFPKYFLLNAALSLITLVIFLRSKNHLLAEKENIIQATVMSTCFLVELVVRLYLSPPLLILMHKKNAMEKEAGVGMEIGKFTLGKLKDCPYYLRVHKQFRKIHSGIALLNIVTMACTMLHLYYLSHKLCAL